MTSPRGSTIKSNAKTGSHNIKAIGFRLCRLLNGPEQPCRSRIVRVAEQFLFCLMNCMHPAQRILK